MILENINNNFIKYNSFYSCHINDYCLYCVDLIKKFLYNNQNKYNIIVGTELSHFNNTNKTITIDFQIEHTLVKYGGRSVNEIIYGNAKHENGNYLVRIDNFNHLNKSDYLIEYSLSNYENVLQSNKFDNFVKKLIPIHPILYNINFDNSFKENIITIFTLNNHRRFKVFDDLSKMHINYKNFDNIFDKNIILDLYKRSKILVNVHQTDHHHTFEELRVLPALLNGVIIISEKSAFTEYIPYNEYIIWCEYDEIQKKVEEVNNNYKFYYDKIFVNSNLKKILNEMVIYNNQAFAKYLA